MSIKKSNVVKAAIPIAYLVLDSLGGGGVVLADDANNWGCLQIDVRLEGKGLNNSAYIVKHDLYYPGATDGLDSGYDTEQTLFFQNMSGGFVYLENKKLNQEISANSSRTAKHVKGYYKGKIKAGSEPNIIVELTWLYAEPNVGRFGDMPLIATKETPDGNNIENGGYRGDIRAEMDYSGPDFASIPFGKLPAGSYTPDTPFLHLRIDFEKLIADLDNKNPSTVNFKDYVIGTKYYGEEGRYLADISGPDGVPDFIVDIYDIAKIAEQWLMRVEDGHIVSKVERVIRPILMAEDYRRSRNTQELLYGKEKAAQLREEALSNRRVQLAKNYARDIGPRLFEEKSNLRNMLELSNNNHDKALSGHYSTIDDTVANTVPPVSFAARTVNSRDSPHLLISS